MDEETIIGSRLNTDARGGVRLRPKRAVRAQKVLKRYARLGRLPSSLFGHYRHCPLFELKGRRPTMSARRTALTPLGAARSCLNGGIAI